MNVLDSIFENNFHSSSSVQQDNNIATDNETKSLLEDSKNDNADIPVDLTSNVADSMILDESDNIKSEVSSADKNTKEEEENENTETKQLVDISNELPEKKAKTNDGYRPSFRCKISFDVRHMSYAEYVECHYDKMREVIWNESFNPSMRSHNNPRITNSSIPPNIMNNTGYFNHQSNQIIGMMSNQNPGPYYEMGGYDPGRGHHNNYFRGIGGRRGGYRGRG